MKRAAYVLSLVLVAAFCSAPALAGSPATLVGSASYQDLDKVKAGVAAFDLTFPVGRHFAIGPVVEYTYLKVDVEDAETTLTVTDGPPQASNPIHVDPPPTDVIGVAAIPVDEDGRSSVLSFGLRTALYVQKSHNGVGFSFEATMPLHDAEGVLLTPGVFFEAAAGSKGLFRMEYQHPFHESHGEEIDLEGWRVSAGFGRRF